MLISIVINNFNYGRFVSRSIESALDQTYPEKEVIVVDDGSTDDSFDRISKYSRRVAVIQKANGGQASALNAGFAATQGELVIFLDADDYLAPNALERVAANREAQAAKIHWRMRVVDADENELAWIPKRKWLLAEGYVAETQAKRGIVSPPTSGNAFARAFLNQIMPIPEELFRINADSYLFARAPFYGDFVAIDEPLGSYRVHAGSSKRRPRLERQLISLRQGLFINEVMAQDAQARGIPIADDVIFRNYGLLQARLTSLAHNSAQHPIENDTPGRIWRIGWKYLWKTDWQLWPRRALEFTRLSWDAMLLFVKRTAARRRNQM